MISKICYMNDEKKDVVVRVLDTRYDPIMFTGDTYTTLKACEVQTFEVHMPDDGILYLKKWAGMVLISYIAPSVLAQLSLSQPSKGDA